MSHSSPSPSSSPSLAPPATTNPIILSPNARDNYPEWCSHVHLLLSNAGLTSISVKPHVEDPNININTDNIPVPEPRPTSPGKDRDTWDERAKAAMTIIRSTLTPFHRLDIAEETQPAEAFAMMADLCASRNIRGSFRVLVLAPWVRGNGTGTGSLRGDGNGKGNGDDNGRGAPRPGGQYTFIGSLFGRAETRVGKILGMASAETFGEVSCGFDQSHVSMVLQAYGEDWNGTGKIISLINSEE